VSQGSQAQQFADRPTGEAQAPVDRWHVPGQTPPPSCPPPLQRWTAGESFGDDGVRYGRDRPSIGASFEHCGYVAASQTTACCNGRRRSAMATSEFRRILNSDRASDGGSEDRNDRERDHRARAVLAVIRKLGVLLDVRRLRYGLFIAGCAGTCRGRRPQDRLVVRIAS
jgi:hypothetical protein